MIVGPGKDLVADLDDGLLSVKAHEFGPQVLVLRSTFDTSFPIPTNALGCWLKQVLENSVDFNLKLKRSTIALLKIREFCGYISKRSSLLYFPKAYATSTK